MKRNPRVLLAMAVAGPFLGLFIAAVIIYLTPTKYESAATIEVKPQVVSFKPFGHVLVSPPITPSFIGTEIERIRSRNLLLQVVERLDLAGRWEVDQDAAVEYLKAMVDVRKFRDSDLISIRVRHPSKEDARDVAAEVVNAYAANWAETIAQEEERFLDRLKLAVKEQEEKVDERRKILATISAPQERPQTPGDAIWRGGGPDYDDAKQELETEQTLLRNMKSRLIGGSISTRHGGSVVVIHDHPRISQTPVSPNPPMYLGLGVSFGFLLSPLMALMVVLVLNLVSPGKAPSGI